MLQDLLQGFKELVFPDNCFLCKDPLGTRHAQQLCQRCFLSIPLNVPPFCLKCSRHMKAMDPCGLCPSCLKASPVFDAAWSACLYEKPLTQLLPAFKYHGKTHLKKTFGRLMIEFIDTYHVPLKNFDMIMPIPLHPVRLRERGFNQAQLLSQILADHYHIRHETTALERVKLTQPQALQEVKQRWTNVQGAFKIGSFLKIADKNILVVDDLLTTSATASAACEALKQGGAAYVGLLTLSTTP